MRHCCKGYIQLAAEFQQNFILGSRFQSEHNHSKIEPVIRDFQSIQRALHTNFVNHANWHIKLRCYVLLQNLGCSLFSSVIFKAFLEIRQQLRLTICENIYFFHTSIFLGIITLFLQKTLQVHILFNQTFHRAKSTQFG